MILSSGVFVVALVIVVVVQVMHRMAGSVVAIAWALGVLAWGLARLNEGAALHFFGIRSDKRVFVVLMLGFVLYNLRVIYRELKARRSARKARG